MHNAAADALPDIDDTLPRLTNTPASPANNNGNSCSDDIMAKYGCSTNRTSIVTDPANQMWMQGSPPVFLNNEASLVSRALDGFACAVRTCCDQANNQFADMAKASGMNMPGGGEALGPTPTAAAVMANENELCSRNMVLSAKALLDQHYAGMSDGGGKVQKHGLFMMVSALSAFLDGGDEEQGEMTEGQIKNLLAACEILIQRPLLLHSPGPVYHMTSNAAIMLCHLLNGLQAKANQGGGDGSASSSSSSGGGMEEMLGLFGEALDILMSIRKILNNHRKSLPARMRCHEVPRPTGIAIGSSTPIVDLGETLMCSCRGCQGFVLMGCSPCVAAERLMKATKRSQDEEKKEGFGDFGNRNQRQEQGFAGETNELKRQFGDDVDDMSLDDDALLEVLSRIVQY